MTREEAINTMRMHSRSFGPKVRLAMEVLVPELRENDLTTITWRPCKAGERFAEKALIRYPAYVEIGYYAKGDGEWCWLHSIEHTDGELRAYNEELINQAKENFEDNCNFCARLKGEGEYKSCPMYGNLEETKYRCLWWRRKNENFKGE